MFDLTSRSALVTGGQRGLGAAITTELLARAVERVYVTARAPRPSTDPRIVPIALDVTSPDSVSQLPDLIGDVSILVNNAGRSASSTKILASSLEDIQSVFDTNVFGPIRVIQQLAPILARHETSAIVNMHSVLSWLAGTGAYGASKAALWSISNSLRLELEAQGTFVTGVHLSFADTEMTAGLPHVKKTSPSLVAVSVVDGLEASAAEVLVDADSRAAKEILSGPVQGLVLRM
ncbi:SDR family oxidoreductase [Glaciihabitans sp. UYNi722]|uniref:SDR family oxidoreductase n=1 Tax=Glaciihabitans sp. UYNi722 TaxID=3156344 RepID=UPI003391C1F0